MEKKFLGYMEYNFSGLNVIENFNKMDASEIFLSYFELRKAYKLVTTADYKNLSDYLVGDIYFLMNNDPRYRGKKVFFTGNVVKVKKNDLLFFLKKHIELRDLIVPLFIIPFNNIGLKPEYMITTQEDPVFEILSPID